ncbi:Ferric siderophore transport system, periplasmic binding protein TonB [Minicystis rosea]|nr:Ferric siderophore transport system, periplasmic binding protein TonB [Minicystis rosea]
MHPPRAILSGLAVSLAACAASPSAPVVVGVPAPAVQAEAPAPIAAPPAASSAPPPRAPAAIAPPRAPNTSAPPLRDVRSDDASGDDVFMVVGDVAKPPSKPLAPSPPRPRPKTTDWKCTFPKEAVKAAVESTSVPVKITVGAQGTVEGAVALVDRGYGFAEEAVACAKRQLFFPVVDANGRPVPSTFVMTIRFVQ